jgi:4-carboxymuconolactone decarboxylase
MSRIPRPTPDELTGEQRRLYDAITGGSRSTGPQHFRLADAAGRLEGPFNAMLLNPPIGDALQRLGTAIRYEGRLTDRAREIAILAVAAHWNCEFERHAHEPVARHAGLTDADLAALRQDDRLDLDDPEEATVLAVTRRLLAAADLDATSFHAAADVLGADRLFELTSLVGYYSTLALQLRVFDA